MADSTESGGMTRQVFQVAYDGRSDVHAMEVQDLAPALLSFGRLVRDANAELNGKRATVQVLVTSDFEHRCFNINFEVVQTILDMVAGFFKSEEVKTAKDILVDLGIIGGSGGLGLFGYLRWKKGREVNEIREADDHGIVIVQIGDGNTARVTRNAVELSKNAKIRAAVEGVLAPVGANNLNKISFSDRGTELASYDEADAKDIIASFDVPAFPQQDDKEEQPDTITAWLRLYSPVYDEHADKWRFWYGDHPIYADISETSIAHDAIRKGGTRINDLYKVKMQVTQHITKGGNSRPEYKVIAVLDFREAPHQTQLPLADRSHEDD